MNRRKPKPQPAKTTPPEESTEGDKPIPEPVDDETTLKKLNALKAPGLHDDEAPSEAVLDKIPQEKRAEAARAPKRRIQRIRAFALGEVEDPDL